MTVRDHPLRRSYALELALGVSCALVAAWVWIGREPGTRARDEPRAAASAAELRPARSATLAQPAAEPAAREAPPPRPGQTLPSTPAPRPLVRVPRARAPVSAPPGEIEVLVRHANGTVAVGIPLALELEARNARASGQGLTTDDQGRARLPLAWFAQPSAAFQGYRYVLRVKLPAGEPIEVDFGDTRPALVPVTIVLPPGGSLHVRVLGEGEVPVVDGASVYALVRTSSGGVARGQAGVHAGLAVFPWVGLDTELELRGTFDDMRGPPAHLTLRGPTFQEERVEGELHLGAEWPLLAFRIVDEHRRPLGSTRLSWRLSLPPFSPQSGATTTDPGGLATLRVTATHLAPEPRQLSLSLEGPEPRDGELELPLQLVAGAATDLGDVVLWPRP